MRSNDAKSHRRVRARLSRTSRASEPRGLQERVVKRALAALKSFPGNARQHSDAQIALLMKNINRIWTNPILIDETGMILAGHARAKAAERLGLKEVPTLTVAGLSEAEKRAIVIADNRIAEQAEWDFDGLRTNLEELLNVDFDIELTGFSTGEIDLLLDGQLNSITEDFPDQPTAIANDGPAISRPGDVWELGRHRILCGNALQEESYNSVLQHDAAQMLVTDPPFNVPIQGHAVGRGKSRHRNFKMAAGEMSSDQFTNFLATFIRWAIAYTRSGAIHYLFMDWRHLPELLAAALDQYTEWKNLLIWNKSNAGLGSFYRSKHELSSLQKRGHSAHQ
jgi:ParB-like nuclease family protein